ncbi:hypothetical protein E2C01_002912 [Portunus trituberculatus]|uniref:Uncharacterized protein n=1 Tax=Portunus trituberculatus TaxID=210409 RepID=A0A5B7CLI9_PORTR|nr:hypothetical protein [Portunus trituberculatus]
MAQAILFIVIHIQAHLWCNHLEPGYHIIMVTCR